MINLSRCLGALVVLSVFASAAACASAPSEGSAAQTNALSRKDPGAECPVYAAPICKPGETLRTITNADGCQAPECR